MTNHLWEMGEQCGEDHCHLQEMEARINQMQVVIVGLSQELELSRDMIQAQSLVLGVQNQLLLEMERVQSREKGRLDRVERMVDLAGRTIGNPILIKEEEDEVTLVETLEVVMTLITIEDWILALVAIHNTTNILHDSGEMKDKISMKR